MALKTTPFIKMSFVWQILLQDRWIFFIQVIIYNHRRRYVSVGCHVYSILVFAIKSID